MSFALDNDPSQSEISGAINYLLANFGANMAADPVTGEITGPTGIVIAYLYRYLSVRYADSADGSVNFSNSPTNRAYYGLRNSDDSTESTNPADYIWFRVAGGFGTTKFLFYQTTGGRQIDIAIDTTNPTPNYVQDSGTAIDLDSLTAGRGRQIAYPTIYQWTATSTPPARPSTTTVFTWATGTYPAPAGWTSTPLVDTASGHYLWAITVPLSASPNDLTSVCDWTNVSYAIYNVSSNGATGSNGLNFLNAYRVQNQASPTPSFTATTSGATIPTGWVGTAPAVTVGEVLWYIQGQYNSSGITINGVAPNTTAWTGPIAASIFQDIRSDNWNGSNPPVAGSIGTHGTAGYYIQRDTGDMYLNSVYGRGVARFDGTNNATGGYSAAILANLSLGQNVGVEAYTNSTFPTSGAFRAYNQSGSGGNAIYASQSGAGNGILGASVAGNGVLGTGATGVVGNGTIGVQGNGGGPGGVGVQAVNTGGAAAALDVIGDMRINSSSLVANLNADLLDSYQGSTYARVFATNSGDANPSSSRIIINGNTSTGIPGAYVATSGSGDAVVITVQSTSPSDVRLKQEIAETDLGLDFVNKLRPVSYKLIADPKQQKGYGFIANEVEDLIGLDSSLVYYEPDWTVGDQKGFKTIHYPSYIAVLVKAIQELSAEIETLKARG
jgi:hypothetical protein